MPDLLEELIRRQMQPAVPYTDAPDMNASMQPAVPFDQPAETPEQKALRLALARMGSPAVPFASQPVTYPTPAGDATSPEATTAPTPAPQRSLLPTAAPPQRPVVPWGQVNPFILNPSFMRNKSHDDDPPMVSLTGEPESVTKWRKETGAAPNIVGPTENAVDPTSPEATTAPKPAFGSKPSLPDYAGMLSGKVGFGGEPPKREVDGTPMPPEGGAPRAAGPTPLRSTTMQAPVEQAAQQAGMLGGPGGFLGGLGDIGSKIMSGLSKHSNMLMALGAGMMGAPTLAQGLSRGFSYAIPGHEADIKQGLLQANQTTAYNALLSVGVPQHLAAAGATDPTMRKSLLDAYMAPKMELKEVKTKNSWGEEGTQLYAVDPRNPRNGYNVLTGQPIGEGEAAGGRTVGTLPGGMVRAAQGAPTIAAPAGGPGAPATAGPAPAVGGGQPAIAGAPGAPALPPGQQQSQFYAPGIGDQNFDHTAVGEDYLKQFSPEVQAAIKDRVQGLQPSAGAGRGGAMIAARIAQASEKYGRDIGMPMDAAAVGARMKYAKDLTSESASTAGGKKRALQQGLGHFSQLSDAMVDLNLSGGLGFEKLAKLQNTIRASRTDQQEKIARAQALGDRLAGEMGQLTSTAGGSKGEREKTAQLVSDAFGSGPKAAGALKGIVDVLQGGIEALEKQRDDLFPQGMAPKGANFIGPTEEAQIAHIRHNIAVLEGKAPRPEAGQAAGAPAGATGGAAGPAKVQWSIQQ